MIEENEDLIWYSIHKYVTNPNKLSSYTEYSKEDILQVARMAFYNSILKFDPTRGTKFTTYVVLSIVREVRHFMREQGTFIRPTRSVFEMFLAIRREQDKYGMDISIEDIAENLNVPVEEVDKALNILGNTVKYLDEDDTDTLDLSSEYFSLGNSAEDIALSNIEYIELISQLKEIIMQMDEEDQRIAYKLIKGINLKKIASEENVPISKVRRVLIHLREEIGKVL